MRRRLFRPCGSANNRQRRGAAIVEFAVVLPLLLTLLFGIIDFGWVFLVRQTLTNAAREGARVAVLRTSTVDDVGTRVRQVMAPLGYAEGAQWNYTAAAIDADVQQITVTIGIDDISLTGGFILGGGYDITGTCSMRKEGS